MTRNGLKTFQTEVRKELITRNWHYKDLANATGYKVKTLYAFMSGNRVTENVAEAISKALDIPSTYIGS